MNTKKAQTDDAIGTETVRRMEIFRHSDGRPLMETGAMAVAPSPVDVRESIINAVQSGYTHGERVRLIFSTPGFSLTHVWFKANYPLPLHTHDVDCLYYIMAGSVRLGTETLGARDGFFLPANVPYTYKVGPDGVELLEFRTAETFDFKNMNNSVKFWNKAAEIAAANQKDWQEATPPLPEPLAK